MSRGIVLLGEFIGLKLSIAIFLCIGDFVIEHFDLLSIQYFNVCLLEIWKLGKVELPVIIIEESET